MKPSCVIKPVSTGLLLIALVNAPSGYARAARTNGPAARTTPVPGTNTQTATGLRSKRAALLLTQPGKAVFTDNFSSPQTSERWHFNQDWSVENGVLQRDKDGDDTTRIFLKNARYGDSIIHFDFRFTGAHDIRLVTGGGGHYNAVVHLRRDQFYLQTALDKHAPYFPMRHSECAFRFQNNRWYSLTVEFIGDELVAQIDGQHLVYAKHPILKTTREYFAFQVDESGAEFDNVEIHTAKAIKKPDSVRQQIQQLAIKHLVPKPQAEALRIAKSNAHARLHLQDERYRQLVQQVDELDARNKRAYPQVFQSHKEFQKGIQAERKRLNANDAHYKELLHATHRANRAMESFLVDQKPEIASWPNSRRKRELGRLQKQYSDDPQYVALRNRHLKTQQALETAYPTLFVTNDEFTQLRRKRRQRVEKTDEFRRCMQTRAAAYRAQQNYLKNDTDYGRLLSD